MPVTFRLTAIDSPFSIRVSFPPNIFKAFFFINLKIYDLLWIYFLLILISFVRGRALRVPFARHGIHQREVTFFRLYVFFLNDSTASDEIWYYGTMFISFYFAQ
jgi:hypothetical protein